MERSTTATTRWPTALREIVDAELGEVQRVETSMCFPAAAVNDIRYSYDLAGGALMDAGCYAVHAARMLGPGEPTVTGRGPSSSAADPRVGPGDGRRPRLPDRRDRPRTHLDWSSTLLRISARVTGSGASCAC